MNFHSFFLHIIFPNFFFLSWKCAKVRQCGVIVAHSVALHGYEMIWNFSVGRQSTQLTKRSKEGRVTQKSISYGMRWAAKKKEERVAGVGRNGGCKSKKKREKNLITQRSKCALCGECRNLCMWKSSLRKKNLLLIFCAMVFRARFFLTSFETRQKLFSLCYCLLMLLLLLLLVYSREAKKKSRREKKEKFLQ